MTEGEAWDGIRPALQRLGLDPVRVENVLHPGHPDVDYAFGNIELKYLEAFPKRADTPVRLPKLKGEQVSWLYRRWSKGGLAWLFIRVGREWFLWAGAHSRDVKQGLTQQQWRDRAAWHKELPFDPKCLHHLKRLLTGREVLGA